MHGVGPDLAVRVVERAGDRARALVAKAAGERAHGGGANLGRLVLDVREHGRKKDRSLGERDGREREQTRREVVAAVVQGVPDGDVAHGWRLLP